MEVEVEAAVEVEVEVEVEAAVEVEVETQVEAAVEVEDRWKRRCKSNWKFKSGVSHTRGGGG